MAKKRYIYSSIDIGTSTIKVMIAEVMEDGWLNILSVGEHETNGIMCKAKPNLPDVVVDCIKEAVRKAIAGFPGRCDKLPGTVVVNLSGSYITTEPFSMEFEVPDGDCNDDRVNDMLREILDNSPQEPLSDGTAYAPTSLIRRFTLENGQVVLDPAGQYTNTLTIDEWIIRYHINTLNTIRAMVSDAMNNQPAAEWCYEPIALSSAVFDKNTDLNARGLLIDLGAGVTSYAIPTVMGHLLCEQLAVGCDHLANDLGLGLQLDITTCRSILRSLENIQCTVVATMDGTARTVSIQNNGSDGERTNIPSSAIEIILEVRLRELFEIIRKRVEDTGSMPWLGKQILLSGDGARFPRITELVKSVFPGWEVKVAVPYKVRPCAGMELHPRFNTPIGAIRYAHLEQLLEEEKHRSAGWRQRLAETCGRWWHSFWEG